jgi:hypothetical protein
MMAREVSAKRFVVFCSLVALLMLSSSPVSSQTSSILLIEQYAMLTMPPDIDTEWTQVEVCVGLSQSSNGLLLPALFMATVGFTNPNNGLEYVAGDLVPFASQAELQHILNHVNADATGDLIDPFGGINNDGDCVDEIIIPGQSGILPVPAHVELPSQAGPKCENLKQPEKNPYCVIGR